MLKYYGSSFIFTALAVIAGYLIGGIPVATIVVILGILEVSLSFDNAVVNASVLKNWDHVWRKRFLVWGLPIAVFGMRLVFPLMIVGISAHLGPVEAIKLALNEPKQYEIILTAVHNEIAAFGGAFLLLVFLNFFIDEEKEHHWIGLPEKLLQKLSALPFVSVIITLLVVMWTSFNLPVSESTPFVTAGIAGIMTYQLVQWIGSRVSGNSSGAGSTIIKAGVGGFLYLEMLDASFSFDGVIAAFALTNQVFVIMLGLAVGAMFVRSMTLHLVDSGSLSEYRYLESGAFWAIGALSIIMFVGTCVHIPELVAGLIGVIAIGLALGSSIHANRQDALTV